MPACGSTDSPNPLGVDSIAMSVGLDEFRSGIAILDACGEKGFVAEAIFDSD